MKKRSFARDLRKLVAGRRGHRPRLQCWLVAKGAVAKRGGGAAAPG
jgi:hypothetical protein